MPNTHAEYNLNLQFGTSGWYLRKVRFHYIFAVFLAALSFYQAYQPKCTYLTQSYGKIIITTPNNTKMCLMLQPT